MKPEALTPTTNSHNKKVCNQQKPWCLKPYAEKRLAPNPFRPPQKKKRACKDSTESLMNAATNLDKTL